MVNRAKAKGSKGEYDCINLLQPIVDKVYTEAGLTPPTLKRNLEQTRSGGCDLIGLDWLALEVKRQETLNLNAWWAQTMASAKQIGAEPVLMYRQNNKPWRIRMVGLLPNVPNSARVIMEISLEAFLIYVKERTKMHISVMREPESSSPHYSAN